MSKTTNKFLPEVRDRAVRMVLDHSEAHPSRWAAVVSVASKIGCSAHTLNEWVKKAEVDAGSRSLTRRSSALLQRTVSSSKRHDSVALRN